MASSAEYLKKLKKELSSAKSELASAKKSVAKADLSLKKAEKLSGSSGARMIRY